MKKLLFLLLLMLVVSFTARPAAAQFQQLIEVQVKPGHEIGYESYLRKIKEAVEKVGNPVSWSTFYVAVGKPGSTYRIGLLFDKWGDRDAWPGPRQVLVEAFGEQKGSTIYSEGTSHVASSSSRIWEVIDDGTANPRAPGAQPSPFYEVTIRWVKPEMVAEYQGLLRRFKSAYEGDEVNASVTRWVLRFGSGENRTFRRTQPSPGDVLRFLSKKNDVWFPKLKPVPVMGTEKENHTSWERYYRVSDCSQFEEQLVFGEMNLSEIVRSGAQMMLQYALERDGGVGSKLL